MKNLKKICAAVLAVVLAAGAMGGVGGMYHENENIYTRARKALQVTPDAGVDVTTSPLDIRNGQGSEMHNLIGENGALTKRCGWRQVAQVYQKEVGSSVRDTGTVHGMWHYDHGGERCLIVHAGTKFYRVSLADWSWWPISVGLPVEDRPSYGFALDGKLWILGAGGFFVYYQRAQGDWFLTDVVGMEGVYVPLTTHGIPHEGAAVGARQELDPANLLTAKRINGCVGVALTDDIFALTYRLDGRIAAESVVSIEITVLDGDGNEEMHTLVTKEPAFTSGDHNEMALFPEDVEPIQGESGWTNAVGTVSYSTGTVVLFGIGHDTSGELIKNLASPVCGGQGRVLPRGGLYGRCGDLHDGRGDAGAQVPRQGR